MKKKKQLIAQLQAENAKLRDDVSTLCSDYNSEESLIVRINHALGEQVEREYYAGFKDTSIGRGKSTFQGMRGMLEDAGGVVVDVTPSKCHSRTV